MVAFRSSSYKSVVDNLRLPSNHVWPMPITLVRRRTQNPVKPSTDSKLTWLFVVVTLFFYQDVSTETAGKYKPGSKIALRDEFFNLVAIMTVSDVYKPDKKHEALQVLRTNDESHPAVDYLMNQAGEMYMGGSLEGVRLPQHFDFLESR